MRVDLAGQTLSFPAQCCCCGNYPDSTYAASASKSRGKRKVTTTTREWQVPICSACERHVAALGAAWLYLLGLWLAGALLGGLGFLPGFWLAMLAGLAAFLYKRHLARRACSPTCAGAGAPIDYLGLQGSPHQFGVRSPAYARALLAANGRRVRNLTHESRRAFREGKSAEVLAGHEAAADSHSLEGFLAEWLPKIEAQRGPAGQRAVLAKALAAVPYAVVRERLMLEASRIEVTAVLDKVDGLKTTAAKRRHLTAALEELRADAVPDDLQDQQIRWLEEALGALEGGAR